MNMTVIIAPERAARHGRKELLHQIITAHLAEDDGEDRRTEQDDEDHRGDHRRPPRHLHEYIGPQLTAQGREQCRADGADGGRLGRCGDTAEDRAEHGHDQQERRDQGKQDLFPQSLLFLGRNRCRGAALRIEDGLVDDEEQIQPDQQQTGDEGACKEITDRDRLWGRSSPGSSAPGCACPRSCRP